METKRLQIRNFSENDASACYESWGQDQLLGQYIISYPMTDICQMEHLVQEFISNKNAWLITDKQSKAILGYITIDVPFRRLGVGEIGYVIGEKHQKHGYASEAIRCLLAEYLINQNFYLIEAKCNETNDASLKLLKKLGFQTDARLRGRRINLLTGKRNDLLVFSITRDEFLCSERRMHD